VIRVGRWWARGVDGTVQWLDRVAEEGVVPKVRRRLRRGNVDRQLVPGEHVVDEVRHHWVAYTWPVLVLLAMLVLLVRSLLVVPVDTLWVPLLVCALLLAYGSDRFMRTWLERLVITDSRVVRLSGVYNRKVAWMPLVRVLDITVDRPFWLRALGCGHLVLENAAQEQGLRDVRYIPQPGERALRIHALRTGATNGAPAPQPTRRRVPDHPAHPSVTSRESYRRQHLA
jgi:hypothetical protein